MLKVLSKEKQVRAVLNRQNIFWLKIITSPSLKLSERFLGWEGFEGEGKLDIK